MTQPAILREDSPTVWAVFLDEVRGDVISAYNLSGEKEISLRQAANFREPYQDEVLSLLPSLEAHYDMYDFSLVSFEDGWGELGLQDKRVVPGSPFPGDTFTKTR